MGNYVPQGYDLLPANRPDCTKKMAVCSIYVAKLFSFFNNSKLFFVKRF